MICLQFTHDTKRSCDTVVDVVDGDINETQCIAHTPGLGVQSPLQSKMKWNFGVFHSHSRKYLELNPLSNPKLPGVLECVTHGVALRNALLRDVVRGVANNMVRVLQIIF